MPELNRNPYCCQINCNKDADYTIVYPEDGITAIYDRFSQVCKKHVGDLWDGGASLESLDWNPNTYSFMIDFKNK